MTELRFEDRVAVVTGAGRGLGRAYALLLAARGAKVVVNDPGVSLRGDAADEHPADAVVAEIKAAGGEAVASTESVATQQGGKAIVELALERFGRVDALVHNAGIVRRAPLDELSEADLNAVLDVHLRGGYNVVRAAFPHMRKAKFGRIVLTASCSGLYGNANSVAYAMAKMGLLGLSNVVALEGAAHGVKCNVIVPAALTRMAEGLDTSAYPPMDPELVAPAVAWLCHPRCELTGEWLVAVAGRVARAYIAETPGLYQKAWSIEDVAEQSEAIRHSEAPVVFPVVPSGQFAHLKYAFDMARRRVAFDGF